VSHFNKYCCNKCKQTTCCCGPNTKTFGPTGCCTSPVQAAPEPCCESHTTICKTGVCFNPTCNVVATDTTFWLNFTNTCQAIVPLNANDVFFYHSATGLMQIHAFDGTSYNVSLVDQTKVGAVIETGDCVLVAVVPAGTNTAGLSTRCLAGIFVAPALNADATISILNGSGIPIGATLTFTAAGETGSYVVTAFVSASGNIFVYTVQNQGAGHIPGTIINGGNEGQCLVPIEIITNVDICELSTANEADTVTVCLNGSPRALVPTGEGDVIVGTPELTWELRKVSNLSCCVIIDGCLKFTGETCVDDSDSVVLRETNIECFEAAFAEAQALGNFLPMIINDFEVVAVEYDPATRIVKLEPIGPLYEPIVQFDAGTQLCVGECCDNCNHGPQATDYQDDGTYDPEAAALFAYNFNNIPWDGDDTLQYLLGQNNTDGTIVILALDSTYNDDPGCGPGNPQVDQPLLYRQKICNSDPHGCNQDVDIEFNYEMEVFDLPLGMRMHYEFGHYINPSATLEDGVTPNPFFAPSSQSASAGAVDGPSSADVDVIVGTNVGYAGTSEPKWFPYVAAYFKDYARIDKCNCALSIAWLYLRLVPNVTILTGQSGTFDINSVLRRRIRKFPLNRIPNPANNPESESFKC